MTYILLLSLLLFQMAFAISCNTVESDGKSGMSPGTVVEPQTRCLTKEEYEGHLLALSNASSAAAGDASQELLHVAAESEPCRAEVVSVLIKAMDKPNLDFRHDLEAYRLWRAGAEILGDLRATEGLGLLISHLNLTGSDFSTSMKHQPALEGVIKIGVPALPKLEEVLKHDPDPSMRHAAVFCIATIGGPTAVRSLGEALSAESDMCVRRFIEASLDNFDELGQIKNRGAWFSGFVCPRDLDSSSP